MRKFLSIVLSLMMVLALMPAIALTTNAAYTTGTFAQVTSLDDLETGAYYILYGIKGSDTGAMTAATSATKPAATAVTITADDTIVDPAVNLVWKLGGSSGAWTLYNESLDRYCEIVTNTTSGFAMNQTATTSYTVSLDSTEGFRFITNSSSGGSRGISLFTSDFRSYALSSMNTLHLYKMQSAAATYTVTYDAGAGSNAPTDGNAYAEGAKVTVLAAATPADGYTFTGWSDGTTTYAAGATFLMPASNVTLTATYSLDGVIDYSTLTAAVATATALYTGTTASADGDNVPVTDMWATEANCNAFAAQIDTAEALIDNCTTQDQVTTAVGTLNAAITTFSAQRSAGLFDKSALTAAVEAAEALLTATTESADGTDVAPTAYWATTANWDTYYAAYEAADASATSATTQTAVTAAINTLATATATFNGQRALGSNPMGIGSIADAKLLATGTAVSVQGWVVYKYSGSTADALSCVVLEDYSDNDAINGIVVYNNALENANVGDYIYVAGTYSPYNGLAEITNVTAYTPVTAPTGLTAPQAQEYATWAAAVADVANINGELVCISNVTLGSYVAGGDTVMTDSTSTTFNAYKAVAYDGANSENTTVVAGGLVNLYGMIEYNSSTSVTRYRVGAPKNYEASTASNTVTITTPENGTILVEDANGDEIVSGTSVDANTVLTITVTPNSGYYCTGITVNDVALEGNTYTMGAEAVTIAATMQQETSYTITLNENGTLSYINFVSGSNPVDLPTPTAIGSYTGLGWSSVVFADTNTAPTLVSDPYTPTADVTLYAVYSISAGTGSTSYVLTSAANITEGTYLIGALRSETASDNFYFLNGTVSSGDLNTNTATTEVAAVDGVRSLSTLPTDAAEFAFVGNNTNGFTVSVDGGKTFLGWTAFSKRKLAFNANYSTTKWTVAAKDEPLLTNGVYLTGNDGTDVATVSENSTAQGAVRMYATSTSYRAIYLFKKTSNSNTTYTTAPADTTYAITLATGDGFTMTSATGYSTVVNEGDNFYFTFVLGAAYSNSDFTIEANGGDYEVLFDADLNQYYIEDVTADVAFTVSGVAMNTYTLSISVTNPQYGTVTVMNGENALENGATITHGDILTITAAAENSATQMLTSFTVNGVSATGTATQTVESNVTIAAQFDLREVYTITYMNRGSLYKTEDIAEGYSASLDSAFDTVGDYTFIGWMGEANGYDTDNETRPATIYTSTYTPAESVTLVAVYVKNVAGGTTGYSLSQTQPIAGEKYIIAGLYNGTYYGLKYESTAVTSSAGVVFDPSTTVDDSTIGWIASNQTGGIAFNEQTTTTNYLHLNSTQIRSTTNTTNGVFTFANGVADNSFTMERSDGTRWLHFEGGNFTVTSDSANASDIYFFEYHDGTTAVYTVLPTANLVITPVTTGVAARFDHTAIRFGARISFADMQDLSVGDVIDYGFKLNIYDPNTEAPMASTWASRSVTSQAGGSYTWTAAMDAATTTSELVSAIRGAGYKVFDYDETTITFALVMTGFTEDGTGAASCDNLWMFQGYVTVNGETEYGAILYNSINGRLSNTASGTYVA